MKVEKPSLINLIKEIITALNSQNIHYALSGGIANIAWGIPRATQDIDILISISKIKLPSLLELFFSLGFKGDMKNLILTAQKEYFLRLEHRAFALEIFLPAIPYHNQILKRRVKYDFENIPAWFISLEDLVILKFLFHRSKDLADIKGILATRLHDIDTNYIMKILSSLLSTEDRRLKEMKELISHYAR